MSGWTLFDDAFVNGIRTDIIDSDGLDLYWLDTSYDLVHYDISTKTETIIYTNGTSPINFIWSFCCFKGGIYIVGARAAGGVGVFKYDGTPDNWTEVDTLRATATAGTYALIFCNDDWMVAIHVDYNTTRNTVSHYTTDGSSWGVAGFGTLPIMAQTGGPAILYLPKLSGSRPAITAFCVANAGGPGYACTQQALMKFTGTGWMDVNNPIVDANRIVGPENDTCWTWDLQGIDATCSELSSDDFLSQSVPDADVCSMPTINTPLSVGYDNNGTQLFLYTWSGLSWLPWDIINGLNVDAAAPDNAIVRMSNYFTYLIVYNSISATFEIWKRDSIWGGAGGELRHLGLAADQGNLYVTRNEDEVLQLWTYDLATLGFIRESTFGAATYAELDARTYGLMPEIKPGAEGVVYLRGRDGNDVKVQVSDESQLIWTSLDNGGWAADKFAVAMHPDPLNPADLVAVFSDQDIWRSQDGGTAWVKMEETNVTPSEVSRHPIWETDLLIAGAGAGANELEFTPNYGLSLEDVSEATMGIVNAIEVSR